MTFDMAGFCKGRVVLMDGAWGTELQKKGLPPGAFGEPWNVENPDPVRAIARAYAEAGAEVLLTNTFRANRMTLDREGCGDRTAEFNEAAVRLSRAGAGEVGREVKVIGSIGPTGTVVMTEEKTEEEFYEAFKEQALALERGGADAVLVETMIELAELVIAVRACAENTSLPVIASMTYDSGPDQDRTAFGVTVEQHVDEAARAGASVFGANCGNGIENYVEIARQLRAATEVPIWIRANAGLPRLVNNVSIYDQSPDAYAAIAVDIVKVGVDYLGGCCGSTPDHIREIARVIAETPKGAA